jgi:hypothetical protein
VEAIGNPFGLDDTPRLPVPTRRVVKRPPLRDASPGLDQGKRHDWHATEKVALVTGGGNGIGREAALAFAREGARVAIADYEAAAARGTVAMINGNGGQAISLSGDVTLAAQVQAMMDATMAAYGRLDCAFNNSTA